MRPRYEQYCGEVHLRMMADTDSDSMEMEEGISATQNLLRQDSDPVRKKWRESRRPMVLWMNVTIGKKRLVVVSIVLTLALVGLIVLLAIFVPGSPSGLQPSPSILHRFRNAAVTSDALVCSQIGSDLMSDGGNAVDAAVGTLVCLGAVVSQSMGLGGGFLMVIYMKDRNVSIALDAREAAPSNTHRDMYSGNSTLSQLGPLSIAVPGEMKGYWEAHQRYGKLEWDQVLAPTIALCKRGFHVSPHAANAMKVKEEDIMASPTIREILVNPKTGKVWKEGDLVTRKDLSKALEVISRKGGNDLYNGSLAKELMEDLKEMGSLITEEDLANYEVKWQEPITASLHGDLTLYTSPPSGSGALMAFIFNILKEYKMSPSDMADTEKATLTYHRIVEAFKFTYARRMELGDSDFVNVTDLIRDLTSPEHAEMIRQQIRDIRTFNDPEHYEAESFQLAGDHGTSHMAVIDKDGNAVSATSTVNLYYGSMLRSRRTGIILNDEMDDFSAPNMTNYFNLPSTPANFISPGKRPLSSMCPAIFVDKSGRPRLVVGAAGGSKITSTTAFAAMRYLWFNDDLKQAIDAPRLHHQLIPMNIQYENGFSEKHLEGLQKLGHRTELFDSWASIINGVASDSGWVYANADFRKQGDAAGF